MTPKSRTITDLESPNERALTVLILVSLASMEHITGTQKMDRAVIMREIHGSLLWVDTVVEVSMIKAV